MSPSWLFVLSVLCVSVVISKEVNDRPLLTCFRCFTESPRCGMTCQGLYCYKQTLEIADEAPVVKRGCVNETDLAANVGCTSKYSTLPGSSTASTEHFCICKTHKCNVSSSIKYTTSLLVVLCIIAFSL